MMMKLYCCRLDDQEITMSGNFLYLTLIIYDQEIEQDVNHSVGAR